MRQSYRNMQPIWYALFGDSEPIYDDYGNEIDTGVLYGKPVKAMANVSPAKGSVVARQFGEDSDYDRVLMFGDRDIPIDEYSVIWIDRTPELDTDGNLIVDEYGQCVTPHNHIVKRVARSLPKFGSAIIAVKEVTVN